MPFGLQWYHVAIAGVAGLLLLMKFKGLWPFGSKGVISDGIPDETDLKKRQRKAGRALLDVHHDKLTLTQLDAAANGGLGALEAGAKN